MHTGEVGAAWGEEAASAKTQTQGSAWGNSNPSCPPVGSACMGHAGDSCTSSASTELVLETWDLQCERNGREHRTAELSGQQLVVRRGQPFTITLRFSGRGYEEGVDKLAFNVETGECRHATRCELPLLQDLSCGCCAEGPAPSHAVPVPLSPPSRGWCCAQLLHQNTEKR